MPDLSTKQRILYASIQLFNEYGICNVRLQQIADEIGISVGNLAYHFRNKEAIVGAIDEIISAEIDDILSSYRIYPNFIDLDSQLTKYFQFILQYPLYFFDILEMDRNYPDPASTRQRNIGKMISQFQKRFTFNVKRATLKEEPVKGYYESIAEAIWVVIAFWAPQNTIRKTQKVADEKIFKQKVWQQIYPYFTDKGLAEYEQLILPMINTEH